MLLHAMTTLGHLLGALYAVPDPGGGAPPPGSDKILTLLKWGKWVCLAICVGGGLWSGAQMTIGARRGEGAEHLGRLGWVCFGCIVVGSTVGIVAALT